MRGSSCREGVTSTSGGPAGPAVVEAAREWYWRRVPTVVSAGRAVWALSSASSRAQAERVRARCWSLPLPRALSSHTGIFPQCSLRCCTLREGLACYACNLACLSPPGAHFRSPVCHACALSNSLKHARVPHLRAGLQHASRGNVRHGVLVLVHGASHVSTSSCQPRTREFVSV